MVVEICSIIDLNRNTYNGVESKRLLVNRFYIIFTFEEIHFTQTTLRTAKVYVHGVNA